jgi:DNA-binding transcriptional ArsR family regulator
VKPDRDITDPRVAKALAHPLRVRILALLGDRTASPRELALELGVDLSLLSYHVRTLHRAGFLELVTRKRRRAAVESYYRATERPVVVGSAWAQLPSIVKDELVAGALAQVSEDVNAAAGTGGFDRQEAHLSRSPMVLDAEGFAEAAGKMDSLLEDLERIGAEAEKRLAQRDHEGAIRAGAVLMLFESADPALSSAPAATKRVASGERAARPGSR